MVDTNSTNHPSSFPGKCARCALRPGLCFCAGIVPITVRTNLSVVMHASEYTRPSNSVRWLSLLVPALQIHFVGARGAPFAGLPETDKLLPRYLLFPDTSALALNAEFAARHPQGIELVVPDGSWTQAKRITHRAPGLLSLPRIRIESSTPSEYLLRKGQRKDGLCTLEAIAKALGVLESPELEQQLLVHLRKFVQRILWGRHSQSPFPGDCGA
jgi:DTW domain-containing protein YfiP